MKRKSIRIVDWATATTGLLIWLTLVGCSDPMQTPSAKGSAETGGISDTPSQRATTSPETVPLADRELWEVYLIQGSRCGYGKTTIRKETRSGSKTVRIEEREHLTVKRLGTPTELETRITSIETPDGKLLDFNHEMKLGPTPQRTTGRVVGDRLRLETTTQGKTVSSWISWSAEYGGPYAVNHSLLDKPMRPGQQRTVSGLVPGVNQVATSELTAKDFEPVQLLAGTYELLRIDNTVRLADGQELQMTHWTDRTGDILKTRTEMTAAMTLERIRATKAIALEKTELPDLDLAKDVIVKLDRPLAGAHRTKCVRYRVHLEGGDPAKQFVSGPSQRVKSIDPHTAEITVYAIRPGQPGGNPDAPADPPTDDDRQPNNMIQSDDARVVADAAVATDEETEPWRVALALERYVHREVATENFSFTQAFATAADVAKTREGDCSENAVYLAALARALGIPARVAIGLVYMQGRQAFGYHMWTEVHVGGRWIPMDATLGQGGTGAAHLKVNHSNLQGASAYSSFLPLLKIIGRLKVEVLDVE